MARRDTTSTFDTRQSSVKLRAALRQIEKLVRKKLSRFQGKTHFFVALRCVQTIDDVASNAWISSTSTPSADPIVRAATHQIDAELLAEVSRSRKLDAILEMPRNAERRASVVRKYLKLLWEKHVKGTPAQGKKQIYNIVKKGEAPAFEWWDRVTDGAPFENNSVDVPEVSAKLFAYLAPVIRRMQ